MFLEISQKKCFEETIHRLFSKKLKLSIQFVFIVIQVEGYQNIFKLSCIVLVFSLFKAFLKNKNKSGTILPGSFTE